MADATYQPKTYEKDGGDTQIIASGGTLEIETGGIVSFNGVNQTAALATAPAGVAAGYKIARGEVTLDGSNPTSITTGLATVVGATVARKSATSPGLDATIVTCDFGGSVAAGQLDVYAWKPTGTGDCTLIASTNNSAVVSWIAIGT